jgi:hypothetical protein
VAVLLAVVTMIALTGLVGGTTNPTQFRVAPAAHLGTDMAVVVIDRLVAVNGTITTAASSGQRTTPGALPALLPLALMVALLALAATEQAIPLRVVRRLPMRRAPPRDAFFR